MSGAASPGGRQNELFGGFRAAAGACFRAVKTALSTRQRHFRVRRGPEFPSHSASGLPRHRSPPLSISPVESAPLACPVGAIRTDYPSLSADGSPDPGS